MIGSLLLLAVVVLAAIGVRAVTARDPRSCGGHAVRRSFEYLLLYGLVVVVAVGVAGLLGLLATGDVRLAGGSGAAARDAAFVVVGVPLLTATAVVARRTQRADAAETASFAWSAYLTLTALTALVVSMYAVHDLLAGLTGVQDLDRTTVPRAVVWLGVWGGHRRLEDRRSPAGRARLHHVLGSLIGLGTSAVGLATGVAAVLDRLLGLDRGDLASTAAPVRSAALVLAVGLPVWAWYWLRTASGEPVDALGTAYALLAGTFGGLVAAVTGAALALYAVLVWFLGSPGVTAQAHFRGVGPDVGVALTGLLVWGYHRRVLAGTGRHERGELDRGYAHLGCGVGLVTTSAGVAVLVAGTLDAATRSAVLAGPGSNHSLLAAVTLLAVGVPVWLAFEASLRAASRTDATAEARSTVHRGYLAAAVGAGSLVVAGTLVAAAYLLFQDLFAAGVTAATLRSLRWPLGLLVASSVVAAGHLAVQRREAALRGPARRHRRYVLLLGPADAGLARAVAQGSGARVESWPREDAAPDGWSADAVLALLATTDAEELVVLAEPDGLHAIPVHRREPAHLTA